MATYLASSNLRKGKELLRTQTGADSLYRTHRHSARRSLGDWVPNPRTRSRPAWLGSRWAQFHVGTAPSAPTHLRPGQAGSLSAALRAPAAPQTARHSWVHDPRQHPHPAPPHPRTVHKRPSRPRGPVRPRARKVVNSCFLVRLSRREIELLRGPGDRGSPGLSEGQLGTPCGINTPK